MICEHDYHQENNSQYQVEASGKPGCPLKVSQFACDNHLVDFVDGKLIGN